MQNPQSELCCEVLRRLQAHGMLNHLTLIGSWCLLLYRQYFERDELFSGLRTRDMDFLVTIPLAIRQKIDVPALFKDLGFLIDYKGTEGYMQLIHPEVMLEFLVPQHGREDNRPYDLPQLGLNAQPLRYMDVALMKPIALKFEDIAVGVLHPACFAFHKLLVAPRRKEEFKRKRDVEIAVELLALLLNRKKPIMPNGGPDCCGNCSHNRAVQEMAHPHPEQRELFWKLSFCTLRDVAVPNPFWTYCRNFVYGKRPEERNPQEIPRGWITASGLYEGYVRIPWNDKNEPAVSVPATCCICGRVTPEGITVMHNGEQLGFCTNRHYVRWWKTLHRYNKLRECMFETPEQRYQEKPQVNSDARTMGAGM